jgi:hypothetical protein
MSLHRFLSLVSMFCASAALGIVLTLPGGCSSALPQDTLTRFANTLEALKYSYHALCDNREQAAECVRIREVVNGAIDQYSALNDSLKEQP